MTPALYDNVRHRFEHTSEPIEGMAADLGCTAQTVCNIANREGWVRHVPPPRDLSPAAKLAAQAEAAVASRRHPEVAGEAGPRRMHGPGLSFFEARAPNGALAPQNDGENQSSAVSLPGGGEERKQGGGSGDAVQDAPPRIAETAQALHRELLQMLADVKAERERMKREGYGRHDLREMSGTIASLGAVLRTLQPVLGATPQRHGDDHDDIPDDIDEFREQLARRIEALIESWPDEEAAGEAAATSPDAS